MAVMYQQYQVNASEAVTRITWEKTGGVAGLSELLIIDANGSASYHSNWLGDAKVVLDENQVTELMSRVNSITVSKEYPPKSGVADYFTYRLTLHTASSIKTVTWVDEWASAETLPKELLDIQTYANGIILGVRPALRASVLANTGNTCDGI